jgi:hypothetical protein
MWHSHDRSNSRARRCAARRSHKNGLLVETLEGRTLLTINFATAFNIQGSGVVVNQVAIDPTSNAYVAGDYTGSATFGKDSGGNTIQKMSPSMFHSESFVVEYSPTGVLEWFTQFTNQASDSSSSSSASSLAYDAANSTVYVVGNFQGQVDFDPSGSGDIETGTVDPFSKNDATDTYIVGLNASNGHESNHLFDNFVQAPFDSTFALAHQVTVDSTGAAVYVTGTYSGTGITVKPTPTVSSPVLGTPANITEGFTVKFTKSLAPLWAVNTSMTSGHPLDDSQDNGIAVSDEQGIDYVVGLDKAANTAFVEVLNDADGHWIHTDVMTSTMSAVANGVVTDSAGNAYVIGSFSGNLSPTSIATPLVSGGAQNAFMAAFDSSLDELFGVRFGSGNTDSGDSVGIDGAGNLYMSGEDGRPSSFGTSTAAVLRGNDTTSNLLAYVIEVSSAGGFLSGAQAGTTQPASSSSEATSLAVNSAGQSAVTGHLTGQGSFGNSNLTNAASGNFIATLTLMSSSGGGNGGEGGGSGGSGSGGSAGGGVSGGAVTPTAPAHVHFTTVLITRKVGKKKILYVQVTSSAGGTPKLITSPYQTPKYKNITVVPKDSNGDGSDDSVIVSGKKGKKTVTVTVPA